MEGITIKKKAIWGYETIEYGEMKESIANRLPKEKNISDDTKLIVFRFGNNYRMVGYKSNRCKAAMHVLGFDFDYSFIIMAVNEFTLSTEFRAKLIL